MATANKASPRKNSRETTYATRIKPKLEQISKWKINGYNDQQVARLLGLGLSAFNKYKRDFPDLKEAIEHGIEELIIELEDTLYRKALGKIKIKETKRYIQKVDGKETQKIEEVEKEIPPDTVSLIYALKNLRPDKWRERNNETSFNELETAMANFKSVSEQIIKGTKKEDDEDGT